MRPLLSILILPLSVFWILSAVAFVCYVRKKRKSARRWSVAALVWLAVFSIGTVPNLLVRSLESRYPPLKTLPGFPPGAAVNILVLGAGHTSDSRLTPNNQLSSNALARLTEGIRLQRLIPGSRLIVSGAPGTETESHARVMKATALLLGVDEKDIRMLETTKNTAGEARQYKETFGASAPLILVTAALHMPRAMMLFEKQGLKPLAAPANNLYKKGEKTNIWSWFPSANNLRKAELAIHEYAGMLWSH